MEGPADKLVTSGSLALNHTRLTGFDLPKKMATIEKLGGIKGGPDTEIQTLSANVRVASLMWWYIVTSYNKVRRRPFLDKVSAVKGGGGEWSGNVRAAPKM